MLFGTGQPGEHEYMCEISEQELKPKYRCSFSGLFKSCKKIAPLLKKMAKAVKWHSSEWSKNSSGAFVQELMHVSSVFRLKYSSVALKYSIWHRVHEQHKNFIGHGIPAGNDHAFQLIN